MRVSWLQSWRPAGRVAELGSLGGNRTRMDSPQPTQAGQLPNLRSGQYAVVRAEVCTGKILRADGSRANVDDPVWIVFDSLEAARQFALSDIATHPSVECNINDAQKHIQRIWNEQYVEEFVAESRARQVAHPKRWWHFWRVSL
jgi:hypothetical protein